MVQAYFTARLRGYPRRTEIALPRTREGYGEQHSGLLLPVVVLGSFFGGIATPTETAVIGVLGVVFIGMLLIAS